ncbi:SRPBCC family protein [Flavobacteriaceae bacterium S356]|uniref:SRPBCC family protein n=1 Tax=Asprobacillus argus TaxID=3076534 RepID=A0ABU3LHW9_9FLAO|nr:SRPBCC family protein [Flavobacteriaceae bacterium S356]
MKHKGTLIINKPREIVVAIFMNSDYNKEYQDGFVKKELIKGIANEEKAISKMYYTSGNRDMILTETVLKNELPDSFEAFYHHKHMDNTMKCTFTEIVPGQTRYNYEYEYTRINWFMPKLMAILFPGIYKKQGDKWMRQFKEFVEKQ